MRGLPAGAVSSPNIWQHPATYELENHAFDRDGVVAVQLQTPHGLVRI